MSPRLLVPTAALLIVGAASLLFFSRNDSPDSPGSVSSHSDSASTSRSSADAPMGPATLESSPTNSTPAPSTSRAPGTPSGAPPSTPSPATSASPRPTPSDPASSDGAASPASVKDIARIESLVAAGGAASLPSLASYLTHSDPALREAAREGLLQIGLPEAAPLLRAAADKLKDPREAISLLDAADFLSLPALPSTASDGPQKVKNLPAARRDRPRPGNTTPALHP